MLKISNEQAAEDFYLLAAAAMKKSKEFALTHPEYRPTICQRLRLAYFLFKRKHGWPVAYILGHKEFFGLNFLVNKHVLIPRPETELMVEEATAAISNIQYLLSKKTILIDVGTGTGCIPIAIKKILDIKILDIDLIATDISRAALRVAKKNAKRHGVKIKFLRGDLLTPVLSLRGPAFGGAEAIPLSQGNLNPSGLLRRSFVAPRNDTIIITANLPYLTKKQFNSEPSIQREPRLALIADNANGLSKYEQLLRQVKILTEKISNIQYLIFLEIDPGQTEEIKQIIAKIFESANIEIKKDLAGRDRLVLIRLNSPLQ